MNPGPQFLSRGRESRDFPFLLLLQGAGGGRAGTTIGAMTGGSSALGESGGGMTSAVMFAATLTLKFKHLERALLQDESAMMNQNLGLPSRIK